MSGFFYLKKLIGGMLMPIPITLLGLLVALFLFKRKPFLSRLCIVFSLIFLAATSFMPIADGLMEPIQNKYTVFDISQPVDVVVVLGSCHETDSHLPPAGQLCGSSLFRLTEGIRILNANPEAVMFLSGYKLYDERSHAQAMYEAALSLGVNKDKIRLFKYTKDTEEEAKSMAPFLVGEKVALVSSASHLPRAMVFFKRQKIDVIAAPAHKTPSVGFKGISARAQAKSERAFYEYLGQAFQWIKASLGLI